MNVETLIRLAAIVYLLDKRGAEIPVPANLLCWLRRIAVGLLTPELVLEFLGQPRLLERLSLLPADEQRRLAAGGTVLFVKEITPGVYAPTQANPALLLQKQWEQIFTRDGRVRNEQEQRDYLHNEASRVRPVPPPKRA